MVTRTVPRRFLCDLPIWIRVAQGTEPSSRRRDSDACEKWSPAQIATWNILIYVRDKEDHADSRAIRFLDDSIRSLTKLQRQELQRAAHAKRGRPRRKPDSETEDIGTELAWCSDNTDSEFDVVLLSNLTGSQLRWLSKIIASRMGRPPSVVNRQGQRNRNGARAHQLIEKRRNARRGQDTRLRGDNPYESVMDDAQSLFGCSRRTLERAYVEFELRRKDRIVDGNGNYVDVQPLDDDYRENEAS